VSDRPPVRAAGGVVWRPGPRGDEPEVLLVHRPKYDDWSLPKGKRDPGETDEETAWREVHEETGLRCRLGDELVQSHYVDGRGRPKVVRYWAMTLDDDQVPGDFEPNDEVDQVSWLPLGQVSAQLTYERDQPVIRSFAAVHQARRA
jgi:8-oxo-dGTP pyrophosphatase MutT (NUDIX family)